MTVWATVPTMVWRVCEHPDRHDYDTSSVASVAFGGSPSAEELQRMIRDTFPNVKTTTNAYGLTETSSVATAISGQDAIDKPTSVGPPVPTVSLKIVDERGGDLGVGETGEVCITGPILMAGYWNKPDATADAIDADGWLHTGDVGHIDDEGFLFITDRKKDMIIRGGENIYCVEIEQRLVNHDEIADAAIYGVAHPELGEEVKATVQLEEGVDPHRGRCPPVGGRRPGRLQGSRLHRPHLRQAPPQRQRQAPEERPARRGRGQLRRDDVTTGGSWTGAVNRRDHVRSGRLGQPAERREPCERRHGEHADRLTRRRPDPVEHADEHQAEDPAATPTV